MSNVPELPDAAAVVVPRATAERVGLFTAGAGPPARPRVPVWPRGAGVRNVLRAGATSAVPPLLLRITPRITGRRTLGGDRHVRFRAAGHRAKRRGEPCRATAQR